MNILNYLVGLEKIVFHEKGVYSFKSKNWLIFF